MSATENDQQSEDGLDEGPIVTMEGWLEEEQKKEEEAAAVLGGSDEKCCTYAKGAIKRQALYSCLTCCPEARNDLQKCAGICLACCFKCHDNHELVELYTKRNFRCDCPTVRLAGEGNANKCALNECFDEAQPENKENLYNQNFQGVYCLCKRPYPDTERGTEEEMGQCTVCEDWFHVEHLDVPAAEAEKLLNNSSEMICGACMQKLPFLKDYIGLTLSIRDVMDESVADLNVTDTELNATAAGADDDNKLKSDLDKSIADVMNINTEVATEAATTSQQLKEATADEEATEPAAKRQKIEAADEIVPKAEECKRPKGVNDYKKGAVFWSADWRTALCRCKACLELYKNAKCLFLIDLEDTVKCYQELGLKRAESTYEQGLQALASIGRAQQIDAITEYNRFKEKLADFLKTFAETNKVVTQADINRFFDQMRNEKNANLGQPYFCR